MVSMPCRFPYTMSVKYLSPIIISLLAGHLQQMMTSYMLTATSDWLTQHCLYTLHYSCKKLWSRPYPKWSSRLPLPPAGFFSECLSTGIPRFCSSNAASTPAVKLLITPTQRQAESADEA